MEFTPLDPTEIQNMTNGFFNGFNEGFDTDIILDKKEFNTGENYFDVLSINSELCFGENVQSSKTNEHFTSDDFVFHQGFIDGLGLTLNENHIVNQIIYLDDKQKWRKILDKKIEELNKSSNFGSQNKVVLKKIQYIQDQINSDDNARVIRGHLNIVYWDKDYKNLEKISSKIKTEFKELDIIPYYPRGEERKNYILNSYCCFSSNFSNDDLYVTDLKHSLCLLINNTNYKSDANNSKKEYGKILQTFRGQIPKITYIKGIYAKVLSTFVAEHCILFWIEFCEFGIGASQINNDKTNATFKILTKNVVC